MGSRRIPDHRGSAQLWRIGGNDAASRRAIRVSAGGAGAALGISLRMDSLLGDSDGNYCCRGRGVRQVPGSLLSVNFFDSLASASLESPANPFGADGSGKHGCGRQHAEPGRYPARDFSFGGEYLWVKDRGAYPEYFYRGESFGAAGAGVVRAGAGTKCAGDGGKLQRTLLAERGTWGAARRAGRSGRPDGDGGDPNDSCGGTGGFAVLRGRLEQCDVHRGGGKESQPQLAAIAGTGHGHCDLALHRLQFYLFDGPAAGRSTRRGDDSGTRNQVCRRRTGRNRGDDANVWRGRRIPDGGRHSDLQLRLQ